MNVNRNYKDSVFTALFSDPDLLRELYCALDGATLPKDAPVSINTLEKVLFMDLYNDISFKIDGKLIVLIEHQSTINPNMAVRLLIYITHVLEALIESKTLYSTTPVKIPWPEFFVLYNGRDAYPDKTIMKLSDHFENPKELGLVEKSRPLLELEVKVLNINEGRNEHVVNRCRKLAEYSAFMAKARSFTDELGSKEEGIKTAIKFCVKHGILKEFLEKHSGEVLSMLLTEWNTEDCIAVRCEEIREAVEEKWRGVVADCKAEIADNKAEIARLQAELKAYSSS